MTKKELLYDIQRLIDYLKRRVEVEESEAKNGNESLRFTRQSYANAMSFCAGELDKIIQEHQEP